MRCGTGVAQEIRCAGVAQEMGTELPSFLNTSKDVATRRAEIVAKLEVMQEVKTESSNLELRSEALIEAMHQNGLLGMARSIERENRLKAELRALDREARLRSELENIEYQELLSKAKRVGVPCSRVTSKHQLIDVVIVFFVRRQLAATKRNKKNLLPHRLSLPTLDEEEPEDDDEIPHPTSSKTPDNVQYTPTTWGYHRASGDADVAEVTPTDSRASSDSSLSSSSDDDSDDSNDEEDKKITRAVPWPIFLAATLPVYYAVLAILVGGCLPNEF